MSYEQLTQRQKNRYDYLMGQGRTDEAATFLSNKTAGATTTTPTTDNTTVSTEPVGGGMTTPPPGDTTTPTGTVTDTAVDTGGGAPMIDGGMTTAPPETPTTLGEAAGAAAGATNFLFNPAEVGTIDAPGPINFQAPEAPTPAETAQAGEIDYSQFQAPQGTYEGFKIPGSAEMSDRYRSELQWTPEQFQQNMDMSGQFAVDERRRIEQETYDKFQRRMQPQFEQEAAQLSQDLINRGIPVGSELHNQMMAELRQSQGDRRLDAQTQAMQFAGAEQTRMRELGQAERIAQMQGATQSAIAAGQGVTQLQGLSEQLKNQLNIANLDNRTKMALQQLSGQIETNLANLSAQTETNIANMQNATQFQTALMQEQGATDRANLASQTQIATSQLDAQTRANIANMQARTNVDLTTFGIFSDSIAQANEFEFLREQGETDRAFQERMAQRDQEFKQGLSDQQYEWLREQMKSDKNLAKWLAKLDVNKALQIAKIGASGRNYGAELQNAITLSNLQHEQNLEVLGATGQLGEANSF